VGIIHIGVGNWPWNQLGFPKKYLETLEISVPRDSKCDLERNLQELHVL